MRAQLHGALRRYAVSIPLLVSLGQPGLQRFMLKHEELLPQVRRLLREHGIVQFATFLFQPPAVSKPLLMLHMQIPATLVADEALPQLLQADRIGQQWDQLVASVHDAPASRGNPWWSTIVQVRRRISYGRLIRARSQSLNLTRSLGLTYSCWSASVQDIGASAPTDGEEPNER